MCMQDILIARHTETTSKAVTSVADYVACPPNPRRLWVGCYDATNLAWLPPQWFSRDTNTWISLRAIQQSVAFSSSAGMAGNPSITLTSDNAAITANLSGSITPSTENTSGTVETRPGNSIIHLRDWPGLAQDNLRFFNAVGSTNLILIQAVLDEEFDAILQKYGASFNG